MKKLLIGGTLAVGLLFAGADQSSATSIQSTNFQDVSPIDLSSMDLESALLAVQQQRASLLEGQLQSQLDALQSRNQEMATLSEQIRVLNLERKETIAASNQARQTELETQIQTLNSKIDALSNSQQMDMLRLQSLSNKRNEAFDVMTNFVKKMQDSRSSILGNMR